MQIGIDYSISAGDVYITFSVWVELAGTVTQLAADEQIGPYPQGRFHNTVYTSNRQKPAMLLLLK